MAHRTDMCNIIHVVDEDITPLVTRNLSQYKEHNINGVSIMDTTLFVPGLSEHKRWDSTAHLGQIKTPK